MKALSMTWRAGCGVLVSLVLSSAQAKAAADQLSVGIALGPVFGAEFEFPPGPALAASLAYGVSESLDLTLDATVASIPSPATPGSTLSAGVGVLYKFDVLRWVPHLGAGVGVFAGMEQTAPMLDGVAGADYLLSRRWSVGAQYRVSLPLHAEVQIPISHLFARLRIHWGY